MKFGQSVGGGRLHFLTSSYPVENAGPQISLHPSRAICGFPSYRVPLVLAVGVRFIPHRAPALRVACSEPS